MTTLMSILAFAITSSGLLFAILTLVTSARIKQRPLTDRRAGLIMGVALTFSALVAIAHIIHP